MNAERNLTTGERLRALRESLDPDTCVRFYAGLADTYNPIVERGAAG